MYLQSTKSLVATNSRYSSIIHASWIPNLRMPLLPGSVLRPLQRGKRCFCLHTQGKSPCGLTLKRAMCLFHGTLATLSESQLSGSPYWMRKCPSSLGFNFFLSVQPADWATPRRCIPPFDRRLPSPDDVLGANSSYRKPCLNRSSSARAASLRLIPGILDNYPRSKSCYLLLRASRSAVLMSDSGAPKG